MLYIALNSKYYLQEEVNPVSILYKIFIYVKVSLVYKKERTGFEWNTPTTLS